MKSFFLLVILFGAFHFPSKASIILTGQVKNFNGVFFSFNIHSDSNLYVVTTNFLGTYTIDLTNIPNTTISCSFINCNSEQFDTIISLQQGTNYYNPDYCPDSTTSNIGACDVSFTSTYCVCDNVFFLEVDTGNLGVAQSIDWNFGDGSISNVLFTTHEFSQQGLYNVCLHLTMINGDTCSFCHYLGFDASGNLITKLDQGGFKIKSIRQGTIENELPQKIQSFTIISNPVHDVVPLSLYSDQQSNYEMEVMNELGEKVRTVWLHAAQGNNSFKVDIHDLPQGIYIISIRFANKVVNRKIIKMNY